MCVRKTPCWNIGRHVPIAGGGGVVSFGKQHKYVRSWLLTAFDSLIRSVLFWSQSILSSRRPVVPPTPVSSLVSLQVSMLLEAWELARALGYEDIPLRASIVIGLGRALALGRPNGLSTFCIASCFAVVLPL